MSERVFSTRTNAVALVALLGLTFATTMLGRIDLDPWNLVIALTIAGLKAFVVATWYMHLRASGGLMRLVVLGGLLWLFLILAGTMDDYLTRAWLPLPGH